MCLQCETPSQDEILDLDSFDLAFMSMTGHVKWIDPFDSTYLAVKALESHGSPDYLWGPEADLVQRALVQAYRKHGKEEVEKVIDAFDFSPEAEDEVLVDMAKINARIKATTSLGKKMWLQAGKKVRAAVDSTVERSLAHFKRQQSRETKPPKQWEGRIRKQATEWEAFIAAAEADHIAEFTQRFPERVLHPEIRRLGGLSQSKEAFRTIDKVQLQDRLGRIGDLSENYFANMSDVQVGRTWISTGIEYAYSQGVTEYMVVSERDKATCPVCRRIDGRTFRVTQAREKIAEALNAETAEGVAEAAPFPRVSDIDNQPPEAVRDLGLVPPFHGRCRCDVIMLWSDPGAADVAERRGQPPPPKPKKPRKPRLPKVPEPIQLRLPFAEFQLLKNKLINGTVVESARLGGGVNQTFKLTLAESQGGKPVQGVWKPLKGERFTARGSLDNMNSRLYHREAMTGALGEEMELQVVRVPKTYIREVEGEVGSIMHWVDDAVEESVWLGRTLLPHERYEAGVFNILIGNTDRHTKNWMRVRNTGDMVLIDHGFTFPTGVASSDSAAVKLGTQSFRAHYLDANVIQREVTDAMIDTKFKKDLARKLKKLTPKKLKELGQVHNLNRREVTALIARRNLLIEMIEEDRLFETIAKGGHTSFNKGIVLE